MRLNSIEYVEHEGELSEWILSEFTLGDVNLVVGKNASGKTRALNIINNLAHLLSGRRKKVFHSGRWKAIFDDVGSRVEYFLDSRDSEVVSEKLCRNGTILLDRGTGGVGEIFAAKENKQIEFQAPEPELAAVARRDSIQHPFLQPLYEWANSLHHYSFGSRLGQDSYGFKVKNSATDFDPKDANQVVAVFERGKNEFAEAFEETVKRDMKTLGYPLKELGTKAPSSVRVVSPLHVEPLGIFVRESDLDDVTDQSDMSQGMFRALSLIIQVTYAKMAGHASCILIDDIGEGLDFERSTALIQLLVEKAKNSSIQLLMATNDRFVMNQVPLEAWSLLQRDGGKCHVRNYANSKAAFDEFKFTGMTNFDFFAFDYLNQEQPVGE